MVRICTLGVALRTNQTGFGPFTNESAANLDSPVSCEILSAVLIDSAVRTWIFSRVFNSFKGNKE